MATLQSLVQQFGEKAIVETFEARIKNRKANQARNTERREKLAAYDKAVREGKIKE